MPTFDLLTSLYHKPSIAIRAAIAGLNNRRNDPTFRLNMDTYGRSALAGEKKLCFGCMATVSLEAITNTYLTSDVIDVVRWRANACNADHGDVDKFEIAMNAVRCNDLSRLYNFCNVNQADRESLPQRVNGSPFYLLEGSPTADEIDYAIDELTKCAETLEAKSF